jgi:hypothetical protein
MRWKLSWRCDPKARVLADKHYNRQSIGADNFAPPGRCLVLLSDDEKSFWVTSFPFQEFTHHAWGGAWICSAFRNEGSGLSSELIRDALACTAWKWPVPPLGMITFVDPTKVKSKRDPGFCYLKAGFKRAQCPEHPVTMLGCAACAGKTVGGLVALQIFDKDMPPAQAPLGAQLGFAFD